MRLPRDIRGILVANLSKTVAVRQTSFRRLRAKQRALPRAAHGGVARTPLDLDYPIAQLDAQDVGRWAAAVFADPARFHGKHLELAAHNLTLRQSLRQMSEVAGFDIPTVYVSPEELAKDTANPRAFMRGAAAKFINERGDTMALTQEDLDELKSYGIPFTRWREYLEENKAKVFETLDIEPGTV